MQDSLPRRRLGLFDASLIVMGGIVGVGIFVNPSEVAHRVHTPFLILAVWAIGGFLAMCGAFIWAELASRLPGTGGQYLYLREAYHPSVAFVYGWALLLVTQTGGMAAVAVTFAVYFRSITTLPWSDGLVAAAALLSLTAVNCLGARAGTHLQNILMILKITAIVSLVTAGLFFGGESALAGPVLDSAVSMGLLGMIGAAMVPVAFAYGGWQTATFVSGEMRNPTRDLGRGLIIGVGAVVALYLAVNFVCLYVLGAAGLDHTRTPATDVMRKVAGERGARCIAAGIALSALGFLSQSMLTAPRVYYAMARDGVFFATVGKLAKSSGAPIVAIILQGAAAIIIASSGKYGDILNFEVTVDFISFAMTAAALFILRRQQAGPSSRIFSVPGHPYTTGLFVLFCLAIVGSAIASSPVNSGIALLIMAAGVPAWWYWTRFGKERSDTEAI